MLGRGPSRQQLCGGQQLRNGRSLRRGAKGPSAAGMAASLRTLLTVPCRAELSRRPLLPLRRRLLSNDRPVPEMPR